MTVKNTGKELNADQLKQVSGGQDVTSIDLENKDLGDRELEKISGGQDGGNRRSIAIDKAPYDEELGDKELDKVSGGQDGGNRRSIANFIDENPDDR